MSKPNKTTGYPYASDDDVADMIDAWHCSDSTEPLHVWLGWSWGEYGAYVERGEIPGQRAVEQVGS